MASAYSGTIGHLRKLVLQGQLETNMRDSYESHFGGAPPSLVNSWLASIPAFLDILHSSEFESLGILLELRMPIGDERADAVLLGGSSDELKGIVVEMKQWSSFKETASSLFVDVPIEGKQEHPSAQALNYEGKLKNLHSVGQHYDWKSVCLMHNLPSNYTSTLHDSYDPELVSRAPIFGKDDMESFAESCSEHLCPPKLKKNDVNKFDAAVYEQTKSFFDIIRNSGGDIAKNVTTAIADTGAGLTSEQELLAEEVLVSASNGEEKVFIVKGSPGSGKSLVAVHLLLKALARELRSLLALRNNRLMTILRECLNKASPGASGATIYSSVPMSQRGLGDSGCNWSGDLVVCDETQRFNDKNLPVIMKRSPTVVFFYDESQILNPPEQGTKENFLKHASQLGKTVEERGLTSFMRCRGGTEYHEWVEGLISLKEGNETSGGTPWHNKYEFSVTDDIQSLISYLETRREQNKVAMVASFTESKGKMKARFHQDNIRIGHPLSSGFDIYRGTNLTIPWLMDPKSDYTPFWLEGESNNLDTVSSIYGCQGFESDYVGVVWGRDFIRRGNSWKIGDSKIITDNIDGLQTSTRNDPELALKLLQNRYRIFLTRGMLGTTIFCEDAETGKYLKDQLSKIKKETSSPSTKVPDEKFY